MALCYTLNSPAVASEIIDGEAVIMDLQSGKYFSTAASGAVIWSGVEDRLSVDQICQRLTAEYSLSAADAEAAADAFLAELLRHALIRAADSAPSTSVAAAPGEGHRRSFTTPVLNVYSDMQDLLLLDPIHDVDEVGWPIAAHRVPGEQHENAPLAA